MVSESAYRYNFAKPYFTVTLYRTLTKQNLKQVDKFVCSKEHNNFRYTFSQLYYSEEEFKSISTELKIEDKDKRYIII